MSYSGGTNCYYVVVAEGSLMENRVPVSEVQIGDVIVVQRFGACRAYRPKVVLSKEDGVSKIAYTELIGCAVYNERPNIEGVIRCFEKPDIEYGKYVYTKTSTVRKKYPIPRTVKVKESIEFDLSSFSEEFHTLFASYVISPIEIMKIEFGEEVINSISAPIYETLLNLKAIIDNPSSSSVTCVEYVEKTKEFLDTIYQTAEEIADGARVKDPDNKLVKLEDAMAKFDMEFDIRVKMYKDMLKSSEEVKAELSKVKEF